MSIFPDPSHDHDRCVADALSSAELVCAQRGARLTELRRQVLELIWASHAPIGAYDLIDRLSKARSVRGDDARVAPPTVYRALDFLMDHGLIHRIESLNAFIGCAAPERPHRGYFLICDDCGTAQELAGGAVDRGLRDRAEALDFAIRRITIEVAGLCSECRAAASE